MIVTPEGWYQAFWIAFLTALLVVALIALAVMSAMTLVGLYFVIKWAILNALTEAKARGLM